MQVTITSVGHDRREPWAFVHFVTDTGFKDCVIVRENMTEEEVLEAVSRSATGLPKRLAASAKVVAKFKHLEGKQIEIEGNVKNDKDVR